MSSNQFDERVLISSAVESGNVTPKEKYGNFNSHFIKEMNLLERIEDLEKEVRRLAVIIASLKDPHNLPNVRATGKVISMEMKEYGTLEFTLALKTQPDKTFIFILDKGKIDDVFENFSIEDLFNGNIRVSGFSDPLKQKAVVTEIEIAE